ncbi:hypothetical protein C0995_009147 [Termitomyces sp. Mi166|nr:hypothetical protein C0995_009147 [Termitomyces sp. Mi166\
MPRRRNTKNKALPRSLQPGMGNFEYWGCRLNEVFPDGPTPTPTSPLPAVGISLESDVQSNQFVEYHHLPSADDTSGEDLDELSSSELRIGNSQPGSSSSSKHSTHQRSPRATRNTPRSSTNDPLVRPTRQSSQRPRRSRHETGRSVNNSEALQLSAPSVSPTPLQGELPIEPANYDRSTSALSLQESLHYPTLELGQSDRSGTHKMPASSYRSPQLHVAFSEPFPTSQTESSRSINRSLIQRPIANVGIPTGSFSPGLNQFSSVDSVQAERSLFTSSEPQNLLLSSAYNEGHFHHGSTPSYSQSFPTSPSRNFPSSSQYSAPFSTPSSPTHSISATGTYSHPSSSSLYAMAHPEYYHPNSSHSLGVAVMDDPTGGRASSSSYHSSAGNYFPLSQPSIFSANSQICSDVPVNTPEGIHPTYLASGRTLFQMGAPGIQTESSSSQLVRSGSEVNANAQDIFSTYTGYDYYSPNATASSSMSRLNHDQRQGLGSSSSNQSTDAGGYTRGRN